MTFHLPTTPTLQAQAPPPPRARDVWLDPYTLLAVVSLVGVILLAAGILAWASRWRKRQMEAQPDNLDTLASFHAALQRGELTQEEYDRIRDRLSGKRPAPGPPPPPAPSG